MSIAGGAYRALEEAARRRTRAVQLFTRSTSSWAAKPLTAEEVRTFRETGARLGPFETAAHVCYLINLASPDRALRDRSLRTFIDEVERCEALGIPRLVFHPGAHLGAGEAAGLRTIGASVRAALRATRGCATRLLFENTAGQGTVLGHRLEQLARLLELAGEPGRTGVCLDTCHLFAAGYDFRTPEGYARLRAEIDRTVGLSRVGWFHVNDCRSELGSHVDRHAHIGRGRIGSRAFRCLLTDPAFRATPIVLETPKENDADRRNLALLRRLSRLDESVASGMPGERAGLPA